MASSHDYQSELLTYISELRDAVVEFHDRTIRDDGGNPGIRDENVLQLAVARPWTTAFCEELFKTPYEKAAAIAESIVCHHVFNDGNHRSALGAAYLVLGLSGLVLTAQKDETLNAVRNLEAGTLSIAGFATWVEERCVLRTTSSVASESLWTIPDLPSTLSSFGLTGCSGFLTKAARWLERYSAVRLAFELAT